MLSPPEENNGKIPNVFAYVSIQKENGQDNSLKPRAAQIRKCNLTNYHKLGNLVLKEVTIYKLFWFFNDYWGCESHYNIRIVEIYEDHLNGHFSGEWI